MMKDTRSIDITIDTGHRRLTQEFSIREFLQGGWRVANFHFHGNEGIFNPMDWSDDQHLLPHKENVKGYDNYLRYFRRHRVPIILEISHLNEYSDRELRGFLGGFKEELR
jgi:sugar phosphate isomerase/epimerase